MMPDQEVVGEIADGRLALKRLDGQHGTVLLYSHAGFFCRFFAECEELSKHVPEAGQVTNVFRRHAAPARSSGRSRVMTRTPNARTLQSDTPDERDQYPFPTGGYEVLS